ncbi:endopeptidase La [Selenomonas artemidis]|uniref:Lon protease n=1 Tax=Selenomonas artemidis F0399 TaxID=749551 RepID=E7N2Z9_9FIRM|nr:endopeptidase La [Selenomonas artemidis]EFW29560.1 endopeptidase La [Selenomonas artemidis F0399]
MSEKRTLPVLPLRGLVVYPHMMVNVDVGRDRSVAATERAIAGSNEVLVVAQRDPDAEDPTESDLYTVGTVVEIRQFLRMPEGVLRILVDGKTRAKILAYHEGENYAEADVSEYEEEEGAPVSKDVEALTHGVSDKFEEWVKISHKLPPEALVSISIMEDAGRLADIIASHLNLRYDVRQEILTLFDVRARLEYLYEVLLHELDIMGIEQKIGRRVRKQMDKVQRDFYLREKIKAIHKELGEDADKSADVERYRGILEKKEFPKDVRETIEREIHRLDASPATSSEVGVICTYLDCLAELPWTETTEEHVDMTEAHNILERDHYGLEKIKERILDYIAVRRLAPEQSAPILCLVGAPGVGKTSLGASIARAMGRKFIRASLGGIRDEAEIRGHRRTYVGAMPGRIIEGIRRAGVKNPVFLLDEVDKIAMDFHGDPSAALLEVLDPVQNCTFSDHYVELPFDLSRVFWIVTANNVSRIPAPLRDRMEILNLSSYTELEKVEIARRHLLPRQRMQNGLKAKDIRVAAGVYPEIIRSYTREAGVRSLERVIGRLCRKAARRIVEGESTPISITKANLVEFLEKPTYHAAKQEKKPLVGVVTGLAWTEVGGDVLRTEVNILRGKGKLILTGQLGEVMQESAQAALSYVRSRSEALSLAEDFYEKDDIHIHLPEGAIPKDGPSAGITMATAMISALTGRKVRGDVAMTGEITLRGNVLPIGGLKEKTLAAYREGMKTIVLPQENAPDIEDIPDTVREALEFVPVTHMDEVLKIALYN